MIGRMRTRRAGHVPPIAMAFMVLLAVASCCALSDLLPADEGAQRQQQRSHQRHLLAPRPKYKPNEELALQHLKRCENECPATAKHACARRQDGMNMYTCTCVNAT